MRCKGQTKTGKRCGAAATEGGLCFFHANPNKASELGRIGGQNNRHVTPGARSLPALESARAVQRAVGQLIEDVYSGKLPPRVASGLAPLLNLQLRAIENSGLELRLERIEKRLAEAGFDQPLENKEPVQSIAEIIARARKRVADAEDAKMREH